MYSYYIGANENRKLQYFYWFHNRNVNTKLIKTNYKKIDNTSRKLLVRSNMLLNTKRGKGDVNNNNTLMQFRTTATFLTLFISTLPCIWRTQVQFYCRTHIALTITVLFWEEVSSKHVLIPSQIEFNLHPERKGARLKVVSVK